jgi:hypothetical protein
MTKNTRIDLSQFDGLFDDAHPKHLFEEVETRFKDGGVKTQPLYLDRRSVDAIEKLPSFIAELKIMYEGVDALIAQLEIINKRETRNEVDGNLIVDYLKRL